MKAQLLVLFALDGTLIDTAPEMHKALNNLLSEQGLESVKYEDIRPFVSHGVQGIFSKAFNDNPKINGHRHNRYLKLYEQILGTEALLFDGISIVIDSLEDGNHLWGVVTNKSERFAKPLLEKFGLLGKANCIVTKDNVEFPKPHPEPILNAIESVNFNDIRNCYYIGDSMKDIQSAKSAGIKSIACSYGYRNIEDDPKIWGADYCVNKPIEILNAF